MTKQKKITKSKSPVKIREKQLANGNVSLYLDIYHNGKRWYEFLKLYLVQEIGANKAAAKQQNKNTWEVAEAIKAQRYRALLNGDAELKKSHNKILLIDWLNIYTDKQKAKGAKNLTILKVAIDLMQKYMGSKKLMLKDVDKTFCKEYVDYISNIYISTQTGQHLKEVSVYGYYSSINAALNAAVREEIITTNPMHNVDTIYKPHPTESKREYLTVDEVKKLAVTDCARIEVKQAFMFACFCGLRISDVITLKWGDIVNDANEYRIEKIMIKTQKPIYLPLSAQALKWMPQQQNKKANDNVFDLPSKATITRTLKTWARAAGINKITTFHVSRHTFATLNLTSGTDLYTTSKLLGHTKVTTTQIYAKVINQKKTEAVNAVSSLFD